MARDGQALHATLQIEISTRLSTLGQSMAPASVNGVAEIVYTPFADAGHEAEAAHRRLSSARRSDNNFDLA
jgi:hypothetical protein